MNKVPITKGFSIIELMVVIAIIGILTAVAMPAYNAFIIQSEMAQFLTHAEALKNEAIAWQQRTGTTDMSPFNAQAATYNETLTANDGSTIYTTASATGIWVDIYSFSKRDPSVKFELTGGIDSNGDWVWACGSDKPIGECNDWTTYCSKLSAAGSRC